MSVQTVIGKGTEGTLCLVFNNAVAPARSFFFLKRFLLLGRGKKDGFFKYLKWFLQENLVF